MSESSAEELKTVEQPSISNDSKCENVTTNKDNLIVIKDSTNLANTEKVEIADEKLEEVEDQAESLDEVKLLENTLCLDTQIEQLSEKQTLDTATDVETENIPETEKSKTSSHEQESTLKPEISNTNEVQTQETASPLDTQIEQPQEKPSPLNETKPPLDTTTNVNAEAIAEAKDSETSSHEQKSTAKQEISSTNPSALNVDSKTKDDESKESSKDEYAEHVTYTDDGTAIYTDPKTNYRYKWCTKENNWIPNESTTTSTNLYENEHYKWCSETQKWLPKQTQVTETEHYKWDAENNQWVAKVKETVKAEQTNPAEIVYEIDEDGQRTYADKDGTVFFWDAERNAWFPKIDDDFMARYQMSYGFIDNTSESEREKEKRDLEAAKQKEKELAQMVEEAKANEEASKEDAKQGGVKRKQPQEPPKWFEIDPDQNTKVYVSNLPLDITLDEFADIMGKCGMIMRDPQTQKYKLKLYTESEGQIKGDGLCDYIKVESVDLALNILDEYDLRGNKLRVQRAQFQMRGEYNPALKPKRKKKDKEKLAKIKEKLFDWRPEKMRGERSKHEKTVIIKNLFHPELFEKEVQLILDYQNDLREECSKCGTVRKVVIYDRHSEGVAQINMSSPEEADLVIQMMQGRFFGKRQLTAEHWDGKTKYKSEETEEEIQKRLNKWDQYLETEENKKSNLQQEETEIEKTINFEPQDITRQPLADTLKDKELLEEAGNENVDETQIDEEGTVETSTNI
ncbi:17S U2 SnRNP complex component HTATSF1 [Calliphora vicina]|uniref:17S U2 SnRNP complex component HTATSF1 n=1 Tax=Calliphora vicina TaxID=7373 RepID=UPI00325AA443